MEQENQEVIYSETPPEIEQQITKKPVKGWVRLLILILPYILIVGGFEIIGGLIAGYTIYDLPDTRSLSDLTIVQFFSLAGTCATLFIMMRWVDREPFRNLGFQTQKRLPDTIIGFLLGLGIMACAFVALYSAGFISLEQIDFNGVEFFQLLILFVFVAFGEEMLLRGYVLKNLMLSMNKYAALLVSSLIFSVMHALNPNFSWITLISLFLAGIALGASYIYTKNLWFPIAFHFSWNFFQSLFGFNVSGLDVYSLFVIENKGPEILTGGDFGIEGSVLGIIAELLVIAAVVFHFEAKRKKATTLKM